MIEPATEPGKKTTTAVETAPASEPEPATAPETATAPARAPAPAPAPEPVEPVFSSSPLLTINQGQSYNYSPTVTDDNSGNTLVISVVVKPAWLTWNGTSLSGVPSNSDVGTHNVTLRVNDGTFDVDQSFVITVNNVNDSPSFTSSPVTSVNQDSLYSYTPTVNDIDTGDSLTISVVSSPAWLNWNGSTLSGTPTSSDVGSNNVTLRVSDGTVNVDQSFTINVIALPTPTIECLTLNSIVNVVSSSGNKYVFNNDNTYDSNKKYGLGNGNYIFKNVPSGHPMALLNNGITNLISYSGESTTKVTKVVNNVSYDFYYGYINVTVN